MPSLIETVRNLHGDVITIYSEEGHHGCRGCEMGISQVSCNAPSSCDGRIWKVKAGATPAGPYHKQYLQMLEQRRAEEATESYRRSRLGNFYWYSPQEQVKSLQCLLTRNRGWHTFKLGKCIEHCLRELGMPRDWHRFAMEFPSTEGCELGKIAYFETETKCQMYNDTLRGSYRTTATLGKYIRRHWPAVLDHQVRDIVALYGPGQVEIIRNMASMITAVQTGPNSCMKWSIDDEGRYEIDDDISSEIHPYEVYDPALGWGMAIIRSQGQVAGRALIYEKGDVKCFVRSYGKDSDGHTGSDANIDAYLKNKGYEYLDGWPEGVRMRLIEADHREGYVMPYVDPGPQRAYEGSKRHKIVEEGGEEFLERCNTGEYILDCTDGTSEHSPIQITACACCGTEVDQSEMIIVGRHEDGLVCETCHTERYVVASYPDDWNYNIRREEAVWVESTGRFYPRERVADGFITRMPDGTFEITTRLVTTTTGELIRDSEITSWHTPTLANPWVRLRNSDVVSAESVKWCEANARWELKDNMRPLSDGRWVSKAVFGVWVRTFRYSDDLKAFLLPEDHAEALDIWYAARPDGKANREEAEAEDDLREELLSQPISYGGRSSASGIVTGVTDAFRGLAAAFGSVRFVRETRFGALPSGMRIRQNQPIQAPLGWNSRAGDFTSIENRALESGETANYLARAISQLDSENRN